MKSFVGEASHVRASVYNEMDWSSYILWVTCKWTKIRKNKISLFYYFLIFTFTFNLPRVQRSLCVFYFYPWSKISLCIFDFYLWSKSPYVFFTFACGPKVLMYFLFLLLAFFKCHCGQHGLLSPFKVHHYKPRELLMLLSHTLCDTKIKY